MPGDGIADGEPGLGTVERRALGVATCAVLVAAFVAALVGGALGEGPGGRSPWDEGGPAVGLAIVAGLLTLAAIVGAGLLLRHRASAARVLGLLALALIALAFDVLLALASWPLET